MTTDVAAQERERIAAWLENGLWDSEMRSYAKAFADMIRTTLRTVIGQDFRDRCAAIADQVVPEYRAAKRGGTYYSCTGHTAKRWQAAWDSACLALGGDPAAYRG